MPQPADLGFNDNASLHKRCQCKLGCGQLSGANRLAGMLDSPHKQLALGVTGKWHQRGHRHYNHQHQHDWQPWCVYPGL